MYAYFHGLPTFTSPGHTCTCNNEVVANEIVGSYRNDLAQSFLNGASSMQEIIQRSEASCKVCSDERTRRHRVLTSLETIPEELHLPPYSTAPALYSFNVPRYYSTLLRAREFAKQQNLELYWCYARDVPLHQGDRELKRDALELKLYAWLRRHDQQTGHLPSILPLVKGLPVRLTESVDREKQ